MSDNEYKARRLEHVQKALARASEELGYTMHVVREMLEEIEEEAEDGEHNR